MEYVLPPVRRNPDWDRCGRCQGFRLDHGVDPDTCPPPGRDADDSLGIARQLGFEPEWARHEPVH